MSFIRLAAVLLFSGSLILAGCGDSSSDSDTPGTSDTPTYSISGTILDSSSAAVSADITVTDGTNSYPSSTDDTGAYTVTGIPAGTYTVTPSSTSYTFTYGTGTDTYASVTITDVSITGIDFTATASETPVSSTPSLFGKCYDTDGSTGLSATVYLFTTSDTSDTSTAYTSVETSDGMWMISGLTEGTTYYILCVSTSYTKFTYYDSALSAYNNYVTMGSSDYMDMQITAVSK